MFKSPKATVGAIIFHPDKGQKVILLTKRNIEPFKEYWCFPGGHVEEFEKLEDAIVREVNEETGLDINPEFLYHFEEIFPDRSIHNVALFYSAKGVGTMNMDIKEVKEMNWFSIEEALKMNLAFNHNEVLQYYLKTFIK